MSDSSISDRDNRAQFRHGPLAEYRSRLRWRVAFPLSISAAALSAIAGSSGGGGTALLFLVMLLAAVSALLPLWADEARPDGIVSGIFLWTTAAALAALFLCWRAPDALGGASVVMATLAMPAGWLVAWLHRLPKHRRPSRPVGGTQPK